MVNANPNIDVVTGSRYIAGGGIRGWGWKRQLNSRGANFFTRKALGLKTHDTTAGFKRYSRRFLQSLDFKKFVSSGYAFLVEMIMRAEQDGFSLCEFPIIFIDRRAGQSKIQGEFKKSVSVVLKLVRKKWGQKLIAIFKR